MYLAAALHHLSILTLRHLHDNKFSTLHKLPLVLNDTRANDQELSSVILPASILRSSQQLISSSILYLAMQAAPYPALYEVEKKPTPGSPAMDPTIISTHSNHNLLSILPFCQSCRQQTRLSLPTTLDHRGSQRGSEMFKG